MKVSLFFTLFIVLLNGCFAPEIISRERELFEAQVSDNPAVKKQLLSVGESRLFYGAAGDATKPALVFIHGTPGNWQQYARYLLDETLLSRFYIVVLDRPGWGQSVLAEDQYIADFNRQATIIATLLRELKESNDNQPVILVGHSLGASLAPKIAINYPDLVDGLLLLAGSLDPELSFPFWYNRLAAWSPVKWFIGDTMRKANAEIFLLEKEMVLMAPYWDELQAYTLVVQGMKDTLVQPEHAWYALTHLPEKTTRVITLPEEDHLFPLRLRQEVAEWSVCVLDTVINSDNYCMGKPYECARKN